MTDETTQALLPVTQADRDAAASINPQYFNTSTARAANMAETAAIKNGSLDHHENVQAFARHRTAHSLPSQADDAGGWLPMESAPRDGTRVNLCWNDCPDLSPHVELGKWKASAGWCNTYGKPFHGDPDMWMPLPTPPSLATLTAPPTSIEPVQKVHELTSGEEMRLREAFLIATVSQDGKIIGIDHPTEAAWADVLNAHIALRERLRERIEDQKKCPVRPVTLTESGEQ